MRIGVFGGTFDPIHNCHLQIARETCKRMRLDRVVFVPSGIPPHKPEGAIQAAEDRLAMVRLAIAGEPRFALSDLEVYRRGKSYAVETLESFRKQYPDAALFFILGVDAFIEIEHWKDADRILSLCDFIVLSRQGRRFEQLARQLESLPVSAPVERAGLVALDRGRARKKEVSLTTGHTIFLLRIPPCRISSTDIRDRLSARQDMKNLLPEGVKSFILKKGLYR